MSEAVTTVPSITDPSLTRERRDLLETLRNQRQFLKGTTRDLTDEQANVRSTVSALTLGGLIKHVTEVEQQWARFAVDGPEAFAGESWVDVDWETFEAQGAAALSDDVTAAWEAGFSMLPGETLVELIATYDEVAAATDVLVATLPDLDFSHPLPKAPWFQEDATWSVRRVFTHIVAETAQHSGHADIIRESIDGAKSMG
jgi:hypothetical protein